MDREVVWTEPAWEDLEAAAQYIARDSESYATAFIRKVREAAESLTEPAAEPGGRGLDMMARILRAKPLDGQDFNEKLPGRVLRTGATRNL